jgi:hypothetical protein
MKDRVFVFANGSRIVSEHPDCYTPNDNPYPLCKGSKNYLDQCRQCCLYENMDEPPFGDGWDK